MPLSVTAKARRTRPPDRRRAATLRATSPCRVNFTALSIRFSSAARRRTGSPIACFGRCDGEINPTGETGRLRACREARRRRLRKRPRIKGIGPQREIVSLRLYRIDNERCEGLQVPRTAGESRDPAPLTLAKIGCGKQIGGGQDTGQRRAHIVGEPGNHQLKRTHTAG